MVARIEVGGALRAESHAAPVFESPMVDGVDVLLCRACGGRLRLIASILDPGTIQAMLRSLGLATEAVERAPPTG